jgi:hypothetical protein
MFLEEKAVGTRNVREAASAIRLSTPATKLRLYIDSAEEETRVK